MTAVCRCRRIHYGVTHRIRLIAYLSDSHPVRRVLWFSQFRIESRWWCFLWLITWSNRGQTASDEVRLVTLSSACSVVAGLRRCNKQNRFESIQSEFQTGACKPFSRLAAVADQHRWFSANVDSVVEPIAGRCLCSLSSMAPNRAPCLWIDDSNAHAAICLQIAPCVRLRADPQYAHCALHSHWQCGYARFAHTHTHRAPPNRTVCSSTTSYRARRVFAQFIQQFEWKACAEVAEKKIQNNRPLVYTVCSHSEHLRRCVSYGQLCDMQST